MRFVTYQDPTTGQDRSGWLHNDWVVDMEAASDGRLPSDILSFVRCWEDSLPIAQDVNLLLSEHGAEEADDGVCWPLAQVNLCAPLPNPPSVRDFYAFEQHVKTARARRGLDVVPEWYRFPVFYFSNHQAIVGPGADVARPPGCEWLDYELEMACVIGRTGRDIQARDAHAYIFGYTILNDWSARDVQREEMKVGLGPAKGKDFATSLGPYLATPDELVAHISGDRYDLAMSAKINGRLLSQGNFRDIYYTFGQMIERASTGVTLYPGDVIGSGTVGTGCILELGPEVHRWLAPGDEIELEITGLGVLRNHIVGERVSERGT